MVIELTRTAEVTSLRRDVHVDTDELSDNVRQRVDACMQQLDLDELEARSPMHGSGADRFTYSITVTDGETVRRVVIDHSRVAGELRALIELLLDG